MHTIGHLPCCKLGHQWAQGLPGCLQECLPSGTLASPREVCAGWKLGQALAAWAGAENPPVHCVAELLYGVVSGSELFLISCLARCMVPPLPVRAFYLMTAPCWPGIRGVDREEGRQGGGSPKGELQDQEVWSHHQHRLHWPGVTPALAYCKAKPHP